MSDRRRAEGMMNTLLLTLSLVPLRVLWHPATTARAEPLDTSQNERSEKVEDTPNFHKLGSVVSGVIGFGPPTPAADR